MLTQVITIRWIMELECKAIITISLILTMTEVIKTMEAWLILIITCLSHSIGIEIISLIYKLIRIIIDTILS